MMHSISVEDLKIKMRSQRLNIIDIRDNYIYRLGSIPGAVNIPKNYLLTLPDRYLEKDKEYYLLCEQGQTSKRLSEDLMAKGYNVINIAGGYQTYQMR